MTKSIVITARIDAETAADLDALAARLDRSRAWIVSRAVEQAVKAETEMHDYLKAAEEAIDSGEYLTQDEIRAWTEARIRARSTAAAAE